MNRFLLSCLTAVAAFCLIAGIFWLIDGQFHWRHAAYLAVAGGVVDWFRARKKRRRARAVQRRDEERRLRYRMTEP